MKSLSNAAHVGAIDISVGATVPIPVAAVIRVEINVPKVARRT